MRIACICNLNHSQFILARYLRDLGHEVTLFLIEEYSHFHPDFDTYGIIKGINIVELQWKHKELHKISPREIKRAFCDFDFFSGSEFAPAFLYKGGIPLDLFIPIGTDLIDYPFQKPQKAIPPIWEINEYQFNLYQKAGIRYARQIFLNRNGDRQLEMALDKIKFRGLRYDLSPPYLYLPDYVNCEGKSPFESEVKELRKAHKILLISHGRCEFLDKSSVHYKGTDIILRGFSEFIKEINKDACLVLLEYGNDYLAAKNLIKELDIDANVYWLPKASRKEIFPILHYFDAGFGTLSYPHWSYNVAMELVTAGVPLIKMKSDDVFGEIYPYCPASTAGEVKMALKDLIDNKELNVSGKVWLSKRIDSFIMTFKTMLKDYNLRRRFSLYQYGFRINWWYYNFIIRIISSIQFRWERATKRNS